MLFSSAHFVFLFLPVVLLLHLVLPHRARNLWLLAASLFFYAWGEEVLVVVMLLSITGNWLLGLWIERARQRQRSARGALIGSVVLNLGLLVFFKYADWLWSILGYLLVACGLVESTPAPLASWLPQDSGWRAVFLTPEDNLRLPIGISFFTFQAWSYVIDVYRRDTQVQRNWFDFGLYVSLFPQLIAGPIVRYTDVAREILARAVSVTGFASGARRFVIGLGKKMLVANPVAEAADGIFAVPVGELTTPVAWCGALCYAIQIYFDFSAYSDMAIGMGRMLGFEFLENFRHPYVARSVTEFWRRWHISLSTWFRDYVYIPLGGSRIRPARTYLNLVTVFFLCGLWHGASFNFVVWGLFHGAFLVLERIVGGTDAERPGWVERAARGWLPVPVARALQSGAAHAYLLVTVVVGWVFFRAADLETAWGYLRAMGGLQTGLPEVHHVDLWVDARIGLAILAGVVGSIDWLPRVQRWYRALDEARHGVVKLTAGLAGEVLLVLVFVGAAFELAAGSYNPFIYFRF